jgi:hypothetical protein
MSATERAPADFATLPAELRLKIWHLTLHPEWSKYIPEMATFLRLP